jgi:hypothetical protein
LAYLQKAPAEQGIRIIICITPRRLFPRFAGNLASMEPEEHSFAFRHAKRRWKLGWPIWQHLLHVGVASLLGVKLSLPADL